MESYQFDSSKLLPKASIPSGKHILVLVSCGSYNPIHSAHIAMLHAAREAVETQRGATIVVGGAYLSPVNDAYGKAGLLDFANRAALCRAAVEQDSFVAFDAWEGLQSSYQRSYYVLKHIEEEVKAFYGPDLEVSIALVCGGDLFETFYKPGVWLLSLLRKIFDEFFVIVLARVGSEDPRNILDQRGNDPITNEKEPGEALVLPKEKVVVAFLPPNETSSTLVRNRAAEGLSLEGLVPEAVEQLVVERGLYRKP